MANTTFTDLPTGSALTGAEIMGGDQGSTTIQFTSAQVAALGGTPPATPTTPSDWKDEVDVATTANITLSGEQTIDGVLTATSRVLVKNQTNAAQNGIYVSAAGAWSRSTDADTSAEVTSGMTTLVLSGTVNANIIYSLVTPDPITLGTTLLTFSGIAASFPAFTGKTVSGTSYTTVLLDSGKRLNCTSASAKTVTVAPQNTVNSAVNTEIEVFNAGAGTLTIAPGSGVTINSQGAQLVFPQYACVRLKKRANPNTWDLTAVPTGYLNIPANSQSTAYTTMMSDAGKSIDHPSTDANARTFTIDSNANVPYPVGTCLSFSNMTSNVVTIAITSDTMYLAGTGTTGSRSLAQYGTATARKLTSTTWLISGVGLT